MASPELKSLDDYEVFLTEKMTPWSPQQRVALAAAIAEHWLPAYESFSAREDWGDPAALRQSLESVWGHVQGRALTAIHIRRHVEQIEQVTPHMDDFDAIEALIACAAVSDAIQSCGSADNTIPYAVRAALGIFQGLVEDWPLDPPSQSRVWQKSAVRKELQVQLKLIDEIDALTKISEESVQAVRGRIALLKVKAPKHQKPKGPTLRTNQTAFEQYRRMIESDLKGQVRGQADPLAGTYFFALAYLGYWMARYSRRRQTIDGSYGRLADEPGQRALVARNRARDAREKGSPAWDKAVREVLERTLSMNLQLKTLDAGSVDTPHAYGPSLRRLWLEGRRLGRTDADGWAHIRAWSSHRPASWEVEDRRKKKGLAHSAPELVEKLAREVLWQSTTDPIHPWAAEVDDATWRIRINDFPDELMYSLMIGEQSAGDFHDWPENWQRPGTAS